MQRKNPPALGFVKVVKQGFAISSIMQCGKQGRHQPYTYGMNTGYTSNQEPTLFVYHFPNQHHNQSQILFTRTLDNGISHYFIRLLLPIIVSHIQKFYIFVHLPKKKIKHVVQNLVNSCKIPLKTILQRGYAFESQKHASINLSI